MNPIGPRDLTINDTLRRIAFALADQKLADWQMQGEDEAYRLESDKNIQDACYELATAIGRRDLFEIRVDHAAGGLPISMLAPAIQGGLRYIIQLLEYWPGQIELISDCTEIELIDSARGLLESRLGLEAAMRLFSELIPPRNPERFDAMHARIRSDYIVLESLSRDWDELLDENRPFLSVLAETNWVESLSFALPPHAWQPRPWWLTSELIEDYQTTQQLAAEDEERSGTLYVHLKMVVRERISPRPDIDIQRIESPAFILAAQGKMPAATWNSFAEFHVENGTEKFSLKLKFKDDQDTQSINAVIHSINQSTIVGLELTVIPRGNEAIGEGTERIYRVRFTHESLDIVARWASDRRAFCGELIVEPSRVDLCKPIIYLRRRK